MVAFIVWIAFILLQQKKISNLMKKYVEIKISMMPFEDTKILEFNQYQEPDKAPFVVYADLEWIIKKTDGCKHNPEISSTTKVNEHIPSSFSMSTISSFRSIENKHDSYGGNFAWKRFVNP